MNVRLIIKNTIAAFVAQGASLLVSIVTALLVPKMLGVEGFGYWQLFIFYCSYSGLFLFGLNDGCYLINGGMDRASIDQRSINTQLLVGTIILSLSTTIICSVALLLIEDLDRLFVVFAFALYTLLSGVTVFLGYTFQAMNETRLFSFSTILDRCSFAVPLVVFVLVQQSDFHLYVIAYLAARTVSLLYCCWNARDILRAGYYSVDEGISQSIKSMCVGCKLMFANVADMLILGFGRFLIDSVWGVEAFGKVSLSISLVNFFIMFVTQASMVMFPTLRQGTAAERRSIYELLRDASEVLFPAIYLLYFPIESILSAWLPQYRDSLVYFAYLIPICVFNTKMDLCCITYYKVLRMESNLLVVNTLTVAASAICALLGTFVVPSLDVVLLGAVGSIVGRSLWSEHSLNRALGVPGTSLPYIEVILTVVFSVLVLSVEPPYGFAIFAACYVLYLAANRSLVASLWSSVASLASKI